MFILSTIADKILVDPVAANVNSKQLIEDAVNEKFANKVLRQVGLCICFWDLVRAGEGLIGTDGKINISAEFRILVFRPHKGEIIEGKIQHATSRSIRITLDFFDDIIVPSPTNLLKPSRFDRREAVWIWTSDSEHFYFDKNERVRLRIESEIWNDRGPLNLDPTVNRLPPAVTPSNGPAAVAGAADKVRLWDETGGLGRVDGDERDGPRFRPVDEMDREWDGSDEGDEEDDVQMDVGQKEDIKMDWCTWGLVASMEQGGLGVLSWW